MKKPRITTKPGFHDLVDALGRGGTEEWREIYQRAKRDPEFRREIRAALELVDPEIGASAQLWSFLLAHIERVEPVIPQRQRSSG